MTFIQIALTLWLAALQLQLHLASTPNVQPELKQQVDLVTTKAIEYAQDIIKNPPAETKQIVEQPKTTETTTPTPVQITVITQPEPTKTETVTTVTPVTPLTFVTIPTITLVSTSTDSVQIIHKRHFHFETNIPVTAEFYIGNSKRDISSNESTTFDFDYTGNFDYYSIIVKSQDGQIKTFRDRCDGSLTCFNVGRITREYVIE